MTMYLEHNVHNKLFDGPEFSEDSSVIADKPDAALSALGMFACDKYCSWPVMYATKTEREWNDIIIAL